MRRLFYLSLITIVALSSCSKNNDSSTNPGITIEGKVYNTVVIGSQTWTSTSYDGPGGTVVPGINEANCGKLYTWAEALAVTLPAGWRIPTQDDFNTLLKSQGTVTGSNYFYSTVVLDSASAAGHLLSSGGWTYSGDNKSGFNAEPTGEYYPYINQFQDTYAIAMFWSSTIRPDGYNSANSPLQQILLSLSGYKSSHDSGSKPIVAGGTFEEDAGASICLSIRFVKDN